MVRLTHAFRFAGSAGGVQHDRRIVRPALRNFCGKKIALIRVVNFSRRKKLVETVQAGLVVVTQTARVVVNDVSEFGTLIHDLQQFIDLLLVFDDGNVNAGILQHESHFLSHGILVHRHGNPAEHLGGAHRPVQARAVVADDGDSVSALEAQLG